MFIIMSPDFFFYFFPVASSHRHSSYRLQKKKNGARARQVRGGAGKNWHRKDRCGDDWPKNWRPTNAGDHAFKKKNKKRRKKISDSKYVRYGGARGARQTPSRRSKNKALLIISRAPRRRGHPAPRMRRSGQIYQRLKFLCDVL